MIDSQATAREIYIYQLRTSLSFNLSVVITKRPCKCVKRREPFFLNLNFNGVAGGFPQIYKRMNLDLKEDV